MIDPTLVISLFAIRTKKALVKCTHTANVYDSLGNAPMQDILLSYIENMRDTNSPRYLTFTSYKRNHKKDDILQCSAIMLEYPYSKKQQLEERLAQLPFTHYQIDTQADFDNNAEARILVSFPMVNPIYEPRDYTRVASLLWDEIGIDAHTKGDISSTFLFAPYVVRPKVLFRDADRHFLDYEEYLRDNRGHWVDAKHREEKPAPAFVKSDDGLFSFPEL